MTKRKEDLILRAINYDQFGDLDGDGVQNIIDCQPKNPLKDGFFRDLGGALKTRAKGSIGEAKERFVEGIAGEEAREQRKSLREAEHESYLEEAKEMAQERGKEKAQRKFTKRRIGEGFGEKVEDLEEKVEKFAKKAGKHGKGMLKDMESVKVGKRGRDIRERIGKETKPRKSVIMTPLTISVPKKPVPSAKSQKSVMVPLAVSKKPIVAPLIISLPKRRGKMLLDVGL